MSQKDAKTEYEFDLTSVPPLDEDFSLEDILAEYGSSRGQTILRKAEQSAPPEPGPEPEIPQAVFETPAKELPEAAEESEHVPPAQAAAETAPAAKSKDEAAPKPESHPAVKVEELPVPPRPISLEEVVGSTVDAVMQEQAANRLKSHRGLFSRRKLEDSERLYDTGESRREPEPEPELEIDPVGPELEPDEAAAEYHDRYRACRANLIPALTAALAATVPMMVEAYGVIIPFWTGDPRFQSIVVLACLAITALLCRHVFAEAFRALRRKRCVSELLCSLAALAAMADCGVCIFLQGRTSTAPYGAAAALALVFAQWGVCRRYRGAYDTFRAVAMDDEPPYLVTDTEKGACKQRGATPGFYTAAMRDDFSTLLQTALLPLVLVGTVVFAGLTSLGQGRGANFLLNWSALLTAGSTFSLPLCWGFPFARLARHLQRAGCAVAGWAGAEKISRRRSMILTDADLFPPGTIQLNGIKIFGEERRKVMSYAASLARLSGSGLERVFDGLLRGEMGQYTKLNDFNFYEEGGWSATVRGETVMMGTASFMRKMEVRIPATINLKTGIFLSIDRQLAAAFAVKYNPAENVDVALRMMQRSHITPILASRDPNITPALLKRKFHKSVRVNYPDLASRVALSEAENDRDLPRALLFREGLMPFAETVVGSRRLCQAVRRATLWSLLGSVLGTLLVFYLVMQGAYTLLSPLLLQLFLLLWTLPVLLYTDWTGRY